jgi:hypothetical protein
LYACVVIPVCRAGCEVSTDTSFIEAVTVVSGVDPYKVGAEFGASRWKVDLAFSKTLMKREIL